MEKRPSEIIDFSFLGERKKQGLTYTPTGKPRFRWEHISTLFPDIYSLSGILELSKLQRMGEKTNLSGVFAVTSDLMAWYPNVRDVFIRVDAGIVTRVQLFDVDSPKGTILDLQARSVVYAIFPNPISGQAIIVNIDNSHMNPNPRMPVA